MSMSIISRNVQRFEQCWWCSLKRPVFASRSFVVVFKDNEAVKKMVIWGKSPTMRHVSKTHRVALDWLFGRINLDPKIQIKCIDTKNHLADTLTKGNFTRDEWHDMLCLFNISHFQSTVCSEPMAKRSQHYSGEERVTAKSRPMMSLIARVPSNVSSSTSVSPEKRSYGNQNPWSTINCWERGKIGESRYRHRPKKAFDNWLSWAIHGKSSPQQAAQSGMMIMHGLLKSGKLMLRCTSDRRDPMQLVEERQENPNLVFLTKKLLMMETRNPLWMRRHLVKGRGHPCRFSKKSVASTILHSKRWSRIGIKIIRETGNDQVWKRQKRISNVTKDETFCDLGTVHDCDNGSSSIHGKESPEQLSIHCEHNRSHTQTHVRHVHKVGVWTRWDLWIGNNWLGKSFMEMSVIDWRRKSHQSSTHEGPLLELCVVSW